MEHNLIFDIIKKEFCSLFTFKSHGETLEIITPFSTLTDKFVSVFVTMRGNRIIIADGGWITDNLYEHPYLEEDKEVLENLNTQFLHYFDIMTNVVPSRGIIYYKSTEKIEMLPACVFDLANFIVSAVNANALEYKVKREKEERDKFRSETNEYLKSVYDGSFKSNHEIASGLKFNGVITKNNRLHLLEYVTGSSIRYFDQEIRRAIINFQLVDNLSIRSHVANRIAIFNDQSAGFEQGVPLILVEHLHKFTSRDYITRSNIGTIKDIITIENSAN